MGDNGTGEERSSCDRRKVKVRKEVRVDVSKRKSITGMMTEEKRPERKEQQRRRQGEKSTTMYMQHRGATLRQ